MLPNTVFLWISCLFFVFWGSEADVSRRLCRHMWRKSFCLRWWEWGPPLAWAEISNQSYFILVQIFQKNILIIFLAKSDISKNFLFFWRKKYFFLGWGFSKQIADQFSRQIGHFFLGGGLFKKNCRSIFSPHYAILSIFLFFLSFFTPTRVLSAQSCFLVFFSSSKPFSD